MASWWFFLSTLFVYSVTRVVSELNTTTLTTEAASLASLASTVDSTTHSTILSSTNFVTSARATDPSPFELVSIPLTTIATTVPSTTSSVVTTVITTADTHVTPTTDLNVTATQAGANTSSSATAAPNATRTSAVVEKSTSLGSTAAADTTTIATTTTTATTATTTTIAAATTTTTTATTTKIATTTTTTTAAATTTTVTTPTTTTTMVTSPSTSSQTDHVTSQSTAAVAPTGSSEPAVVQTSKTSHHVTSPGFLETTVGPASDTTPVRISPPSSGSTSGSKTQQSLSKGDVSSNKVIFIVVGVVVGVVCVAIVIVLILVIRRKRFPLMSTAHSIEELAINRSRDPFRPISIVNFFNRKFSRSDIENDYNAMSSDRGATQENATPFIMNSFKGELPPGGSERSTSFSYSSDPADGLHNDTARERTISWSEEEGEKAAGSV